MSDCVIRSARPGDEPGAYYVCLKTGDHGQDGESLYREDPDALGRIFVGPYLAFEPELSLILEDEQGICGYALGALDSRAFYARCDAEWRPDLCARFAAPQGDPSRWSRLQHVHDCYHHPDYFCPEPYDAYPSHLHIDLLPRAQGRGYGRRMLEQIMDTLRRRGSPGAHLGVSTLNTHAFGFYQRLGFRELIRVGSGRGDLWNPAHPMNPVNPLNPVNPVNPVNPLNPLNLVNPVNPVNLVNDDRCIYMGRELGVRSS